MSTLTTVSGVNYALRNAVPPSLIPANENYGRLRVLYDYYDKSASDEFGTSGLIRMFLIPKGAKLVDSIFTTTDLGTTGVVDIGWAASDELSAGVAVELADADGIFAAADCKTSTVVAVHMTGLTPGMNKTFSAAVEVQVDFTEASNSSATGRIALASFISVD